MTATYDCIATTTTTGNATTVTFSSIPATYTDLVVVFNGAEQGSSGIYFQMNGDTATNYSHTRLVGNGTSALSNRGSNSSKIYLDQGVTFSSTLGENTVILQFMNYSNSTTNKTVISRATAPGSGTAAIVYLWRNTAAINSISFKIDSDYIINGSTFTLYGIKSEA